SAMPGHEHAAIGVDPGLAVDDHLAVLRLYQPGHDVDEGRLARAGTAEQRRQSRLRREARLEAEAAQCVADVDVEAHVATRRAPMRRASSSEDSRAAMEITIDTRVRRSAPASPPGTCVKV